MPKLSLQHIGEVTGGRIVGGTADPRLVLVSGYAFDTRDLEDGDLFFALKGDERDGHVFVKEAYARGGVGAVVERPVEDVPATFPQVVVPSSLKSLQALAADVRRRIRIPVVGISGSNGKTTTKEMLAAILSTRMRVHKSPGNFNNHIGVPMSILGLRDGDQVLVVELGSNHRGEIARLSRIASPTVGVLTNVGTAHIGHFGSLREIALEKTDLLRNLAEGGRGVVNGDDETLLGGLEGVKAGITRFGIGEGLEYRATAIETFGARGTRFSLVGTEVRLMAPGIHNVYNAMAAIATAALLDVSPPDAAAALEGFQPVRMRTFTLGGITLIDDTYNANPDSVRAALGLLASYPADRRIFVMGEMLELGEDSSRLHNETGRAAAPVIDILVGISGETRAAVEGARASGMRPERAVFFETKSEANAYLTATLRPGDAILVKGSHGAALEEVCEHMKQALVEGKA
jgi:UDP-N-acetylmuramoyl-tripeptide--D-alanyl-D-alanine ligase